ncbi:MAG: signal peptidase I [Chloroflexota bacterium]
MKAFFRDTIATLVLALVLFFTLQATLQSFIVIGYSMEPSFHEAQRIMVNRIVYRLHDPQRGDVIVFQAPNGQNGDYIKRVIGLPGESVEIRDGTVYIRRDGQTFSLDEPYIKSTPSYNYHGGVIPANEYFVLGDNRNNSNDSHNGWLAARNDIIGKAWLSIWPPDEWGLAPNYALTPQVASATR